MSWLVRREATKEATTAEYCRFSAREHDARVDPALVKAVVRGRRWFEDLASGRAESIAQIAQAEGVSARYVWAT